jgi:hypothetical protein
VWKTILSTPLEVGGVGGVEEKGEASHDRDGGGDASGTAEDKGKGKGKGRAALLKAASVPSIPCAEGLNPMPRRARATSSAGMEGVPATSSGGGSSSGSELKKTEATIREEKELEMNRLRPALDKLVLGYLTHHGHVKTAQAMRARIAERAKTMAKAKASTEADTTMDTAGPSSLGAGRIGTVDVIDITTSGDGGSFTDISADTNEDEDEMPIRTAVVNAVSAGDAAGALRTLEGRFPAALDADGGLLRLKLRCAEFVALNVALAETYGPETSVGDGSVVDADTGSRTGAGTEIDIGDRTSLLVVGNGAGGRRADGEDGAMDVDDAEDFDRNGHGEDEDTPTHTPVAGTSFSAGNGTGATVTGKTPEQLHREATYDAALANALAFGRSLQATHRADPRPEVRALLGRTFGLIAFADPRAAGGELGELAGPKARAMLAEEVNQAILGKFKLNIVILKLKVDLFSSLMAYSFAGQTTTACP